VSTTTDSIAVPDGELPIHVTTPARGRGPGIVLLHEIFGISPYVVDVAGRLADAGYVVATPELFWRFASGWSLEPTPEAMPSAMEAVGKLDREQAVVDCGAALSWLAERDEVDGAPAVVGFCLGGTIAFAAAAAFGPSACVSYYGSGVVGMLDRLDDIGCPVLLHYGSRDPYIAGPDVDAVAAATAERDAVVLNVEIAGHAFDNTAPMFHDESAAKAAWAKTMAFLAEHVPVT
jgi:carboxymethylenebutenolidase